MLGLGFGAIEDAAIPVAVFELDAGLSASYGGSGETFANIVIAPADGEGQTEYDFYRGADADVESDGPTFNGSAGNNSANELFSFDGGDYFTLAGGNTGFLNSLHKENAKFTWYGIVKTATVLSDAGLFGTAQSGTGIWVRVSADGKMRFHSLNASVGAFSAATSSGFLANATEYFLAVAFDEVNPTTSLDSGLSLPALSV